MESFTYALIGIIVAINIIIIAINICDIFF